MCIRSFFPRYFIMSLCSSTRLRMGTDAWRGFGRQACSASGTAFFQYMPIESRIHAFQSEYYEAISKCHNEGSANSFIVFMLEKISETLDLYLQQASSGDAQVSEYVRRLLDAMEYDVPYSAKRIMELLNLKSKETLRRHYINPALEMGLIVMSMPDKPTSRTQAYVKK